MKTPEFLAPLLRRDAGPCVLVSQRGEVIASKVHAAFDSASRKKGLLGRDSLREGEAIIIAPCNAVHMFFMKFAIDVIYLDREGRVVKVTEKLRPWRISGCWRAFAAVELPAGTAHSMRIGSAGSLSVKSVSTW